jgi:hypothetical protein
MFQFFKLKSIKTISRMYSHQNIDANEIVLFKVNHVGCILLNRPKKLNALNLQMIEDLQKRL